MRVEQDNMKDFMDGVVDKWQETTPTGVLVTYSHEDDGKVQANFCHHNEDYSLGFFYKDSAELEKMMSCLRYSMKQSVYKLDRDAGIADDSFENILKYTTVRSQL